MQQYVAFLRGVNVGGNSLIKMNELKNCLVVAGLSDVATYIQSGNVVFRAGTSDKRALAACVTAAIKQSFGLDVAVAVYKGDEWRQVIANAPVWWGADPLWRHNALILLEPEAMASVVAAIGALKPGMEALQVGADMLYQSIALSAIGRGATGSKLASSPAYGQITIRNYNTVTKLAALLD